MLSTEDGVQTVSGDLDVTDEDSGENQVQPIAAGTAGSNGYGTFEVLADGTWTYTLDNADPAVQALPAGQTLQDTIMVTSQDGTDTQLITITITGTNGLAIITGDSSGAVVTEDGVQTVSGNLDVTDEDSGENQVQPIAAGTAGSNGYGTFEVLADGTWTYTLDNTDPAVQALPAGQTLQDTILVTSQDGTDTQLITITITGTNGLAIITGDSSGAVVEDGVQTVSGNLDVTDEDSGENQVQPIVAGTAGSGGYGTFEVTGRRHLDLHARQRRSRRAGAAGRPDAAGHHHGDVAGRHRHAADHHHHHRHQRAGDHHGRCVRRGDRGRRRRDHVPDGVRRSRCDRRGQRREPGAADRGRHRRQQRLRHVRGYGRRHLDLHARQCRSRRAGAAGRPDAAGHHHGDVAGRHRHAGDHHHHHRHQRRG